MKVVFFKNESGDEAQPLFYLDADVSDDEIETVVKSQVGDDYDEVDDCLYGHWWIEDLDELHAMSELM
jgi:hypothetical protein